ncbi:hypothetical protein [Billgrantia kenyensis]|uniref:Uncharacterized protein n=1 Tax=Billgrantia kenyensis TaxID=321266 RepID=A0A7W0AFV9_9GAMM|nr:hypothetical protein [Halomonas kenyensis]MBA2781105.1 hypothetical protein [Halomonas kenyensis]MCG6663818.1 hypothetical protein [Halomonas kenyensis]
MRDRFKEWLLEIQENALAIKRAKALKAGDESLWKKQKWLSPQKNSDIKARFRDEGEKLGYRSLPSYKTGAGEWLYDFVWRKFDDEGHLEEIVLAMEIEMSDRTERGLMRDFAKLLQSDAAYKIMVFQHKTDDDIHTAFEHFKKRAAKYRVKVPSEFLLCGWSTSMNQFLFTEFSTSGRDLKPD